ncbi:hypothetical protein EDB83DRAFT_2503422 [Lactarius deliciosus]|nr:hypothetical protein EDB83DRAFT_2503422 [Lactarius deliciosus]
MPAKKYRFYSPTQPPSLSMSELVCKTLDHDATDVLIDKWLEHRNDAYWEWFMRVRERRHSALHTLQRGEQLLAWSKGDFVPENIFMRTVDTARMIPLDRTWTTHVYHHRSMQDRKLSMMPVVFTMLPELMLLRGMHDHGCDDIFIIVTDMKRAEMDAATEYFKFVCRYTFGQTVKRKAEREIHYRHARLKYALEHQRRTPCFPQIDLIFRAILYERRPPFIVLFSHQTTSYSQIFFTHPVFVPAADIFLDFPSGCPNPTAPVVLPLKRGATRRFRRVRAREMCNWVDCDVAFSDEDPSRSTDVGECASSVSGKGSSAGASPDAVRPAVRGQVCGKCKLVKYCSAEHQRRDWEEHRRLCARPAQGEEKE